MASLPYLKRKYPKCRRHAQAERAFQTPGQARRGSLGYCRLPKSSLQCVADQKSGPSQTTGGRPKTVPVDQQRWIRGNMPRPCPKDGCGLRNEDADQPQAARPLNSLEYSSSQLAGFRPPLRCDPILTYPSPLPRFKPAPFGSNPKHFGPHREYLYRVQRSPQRPRL